MVIFYVYNDDIVGIEKPDGIFTSTCALDDFLGSFLHPSIFLAKYLRPA